MKEYRFHKEYDYTDHCRSKLMEKYKDVEELPGMAEFDKRMMDNMLEKLDKLEFSTTYDDAKLEKVNTMTEPLRKFADFMGGLLICSTDQEGMYSCTLRLEPPLIVMGRHPSAQIYEALINAFQTADITYVDIVDSWIDLQFTLSLYHEPRLKGEE